MANIQRHVNDSVTPVTTCSPKTYKRQVLALTRYFAKLSISPESSDGFASVGTILPKEEATLLPGSLFAFPGTAFGRLRVGFPVMKMAAKNLDVRFEARTESADGRKKKSS